MSQDPFVALKDRLTTLEGTLQRLALSMEEDVGIARELQRLLMPNRTREIPGLTAHARYISAQQVASESFDLIPTKDARELWVIASWSESFGLSSVLLQALVHLQSTALVEARPKITPEEVFNDVSVALTGAKKTGHYRLMVSKINVASLEVSGVSVGMPPWLRRERRAGGFGDWDWVQPEAIKKNAELFGAASSAAPVLGERAYHFSFHLAPGSRLYFLSPSWNANSGAEKHLEPLKLAASNGQSLLEEMNYLLMQAQTSAKSRQVETDLTALAFEVDAKKLHLA